MSDLRHFTAFLRWDLRRELRRRETLANMTLFAVLILFVAQIGIGSDPRVTSTIGPVLFWITVLFAGSVGLSQTFAAEREGNALGGIVTAPVDLGVFYLAKVAATWIYVMLMEVLVLGMYGILFDFSAFSSLSRAASFLGVMGAFTLGYIGAGVVLAAMTTALRGSGEVLLRILLFPLMIPLVWLVLRASEPLFDTVIARGVLGPRIKLGDYFAVTLAIDSIYLTAGYLLFPRVIEE